MLPSSGLGGDSDAALIFPGGNAGLAEGRGWVNLWCYSGLGSRYELPYINPARALGQG